LIRWGADIHRDHAHGFYGSARRGTLLPLPPYSPELNPVENLWEYLRKNKLANRLYETYEDIVEACCEAWNSRTAAPDLITSITQRS